MVQENTKIRIEAELYTLNEKEFLKNINFLLNIVEIALKLSKVNLKNCEQHLDSIGLQLIFIPELLLRNKNGALPLKINMSLSKFPNNFKELH